MATISAGALGATIKAGKTDWQLSFLPYHDDVPGAPQNSIIGGASLWVMSGRKPEEYKGVARFFAFLSQPEIQMEWHIKTGYVPITLAAYEMTKKSGFYEKNPGRDIAVRQLTNKAPTENSKGLRFGNFVQGRTVIEEELEAAFAGKKSAKAALDDAVRRGNELLRQFEAANK
jgi:sn-glycerol 3-phosphate transport system substrate-binding protein